MTYKIRTVDISWDDFMVHIMELPEKTWLFKGLLSEWHLSTTIERLGNKVGIDLQHLPIIEWNMLRDFQRKYPDTAPRPQPEKDYLWWLALMQHHGAPTRLLDWTYSPFVALYFAFEYLLLEGDEKKESKAAVYAVKYKGWLDVESESVVQKILRDGRCKDTNFLDNLKASEPYTFKPLFMKPNGRRPFVCVLNPFRINERLAIQQGVFIVPGDISKPFLENFASINGWNDKNNFIKYVIKGSAGEAEKILDKLYRMNMSQNTLFPGLDGYARSLNTRIRFFIK